MSDVAGDQKMQRRLNNREKLAVFKALEEVVEPVKPGYCRYKEGSSDRTVAESLGLPPQSVEVIRREIYGKTRIPADPPPALITGEDRVEQLLKVVGHLGSGLERAMQRIDELEEQNRKNHATIDGMRKWCGNMEKRLSTVVPRDLLGQIENNARVVVDAQR